MAHEPATARVAKRKIWRPFIFRKCCRASTVCRLAGNLAPPAGMFSNGMPEPSVPRSKVKMASGSGTTTTAPAPSPKSTQVERSVQSSARETASAPVTRTFEYIPEPTNETAEARAKTKPLQPACTSKAPALVAPSLSAITAAVAGKTMSGTRLELITRSRSAALTPAR